MGRYSPGTGTESEPRAQRASEEHGLAKEERLAKLGVCVLFNDSNVEGQVDEIPIVSDDRNQWPDENVLSIAFRLSYGKFKFFNGGDLPGIRPNSPAWYDMETPVAKVVGPVDAAILDHHGYLDSMNESLVATLSARVWTISVWDAHHPTPSVWERL